MQVEYPEEAVAELTTSSLIEMYVLRSFVQTVQFVF